MKKVSQKKSFEKLQKRKNRIHHLKGIGEIVLPRIYSFSRKGDTINLFCDGEKIHDFWEGVTVQIIKEYISKHKVLKNYCGASASTCHQSENCSECHSLHKGWAQKRKEKGEKIVKPKPEDISETRTTLSSNKPRKILFKRLHHGFRW